MTVRDRAHREAMRMGIAEIAGKLQDVLGQRITSYAIGIADPRTVGKYARSQQTPRDDTDQRLRNLHVIVQVLLTRETADTVRAWMLGSHPLLEDRAPVELLHADERPPVDRIADAEIRTGYQSVVTAAEEFIGNA